MARIVGPARAAARGWSPEWLLALVVVAIYVNQIAFTLYVLAVHDGDPAFVASYLPPGWFDLFTPSWLVVWADHLPWPELLAPSVLHVQAFLELPLVLLVYLVVLRRLDPAGGRRMVSGWWPWVASAVWTATFCLVEILLSNPWTTGDVVLRGVSALVTPWVLSRVARGTRPEADAGRDGPVHLLLFGATTAGLGCLVLIVYDTALLYNLGHLPRVTALAAGVLAGTVLLGLLDGWRARASRPGRPAGASPLVAAFLRHLLLLFLIPALPVRYSLSFFGTPWVAAGSVAVIVTAAAVLALRETNPPAAQVAGLGGIGALAAAAGWTTVRAVRAAAPSSYVELPLGVAMGVAFVVLVLGSALLDGRRPARAAPRART
ncbi:hypothetical protein [Myceligenerans indicum]|uniref:Uncharacterized protein n=1 Tax=Myceligenerans indicum TaxID=2593663 RepID=A0ABS1LPQ3_9MICO|nr:hypothetical protein [Myceligenerans indicum]MBL0888209.1 hypothetical protein [Myceligenerans indicum]